MKCQECGKDGSGDVCAFCGGTIEESPRWYAEGIAHLTEQRQYAIAFDLLEEGVERYAQSAMLWYNGGVLEELMGNRDGAIRRYQQVLDLRPNNEKARKALERLLGRPLYTPPPTHTADAPPPPAMAAPAPPSLPAATTSLPPAMAAVETPRPSDTVTLAMTVPPASDAPRHDGGPQEGMPPMDNSPLLPPPASTGLAGMSWDVIRLITLISSIVFGIGMLVCMFAGNGALFIVTVVLCFPSFTLYFLSVSSTPRQRGNRR